MIDSKQDEAVKLEARRLLASLTGAQKRALREASYAPAAGAWHFEGWYMRADRRVRYRLSRFGLVHDYLTPRCRLTPLGVAVKSLLQEASHVG